jgi:hypothetical protein
LPELGSFFYLLVLGYYPFMGSKRRGALFFLHWSKTRLLGSLWAMQNAARTPCGASMRPTSQLRRPEPPRLTKRGCRTCASPRRWCIGRRTGPCSHTRTPQESSSSGACPRLHSGGTRSSIRSSQRFTMPPWTSSSRVAPSSRPRRHLPPRLCSGGSHSPLPQLRVRGGRLVVR